MKVVLMHDDVGPTARPDELDVYVQANAIAEALQELGHSSARLPFSLDLRRVSAELANLGPDVVFNLVESVEGIGRLIYLAPALLDVLHLPYTGASTEGMFLTSGKLLTKRILRASGIPTPPWLTLSGIDTGLTFPGRFIIKLVWEEASLGLDDEAVLTADSPATLHREIRARAGRLGGEAFAEPYIEGREFNLALLADRDGPQVLPPAEIHFLEYAADKPKVIGYRAKWDDESFEYHHTPRSFEFPASDAELLGELKRIGRRCWDLFGLRGYVRVDFRVDAAGRPWVLEVNANPCLSPDAGFPEAAQQAGLSLANVVARVLDDAVRAREEAA